MNPTSSKINQPQTEKREQQKQYIKKNDGKPKSENNKQDIGAIPNIGNSFINLYYEVLRERPEISHHFYDDFCTITRIDADRTQTVSTRLGIHSLLTSLNVTNVEVTRLNAQNSWFGGIFLIVSGIIWSRNFCGKRKFLQAFFLAPRSIKSFHIMNENFQFQDEEVVELPPVPVPELPVIMVDSQVPPYNPYDQQPAISVSRYELEETKEYADSLHIEDDRPIDKYSLPDDQQHVDLQFETVVEEASVEQSFPLQSVVNHLEDAIHWPELPLASARVDELAVKPAVESAGEPAIVSYASILQAPKRQSSQPCVHRQPSVRQSMPAASTSSFVPQVAGTGADDNLVQEATNKATTCL